MSEENIDIISDDSDNSIVIRAGRYDGLELPELEDNLQAKLTFVKNWATGDGIHFSAVGDVCNKLPPDVYELQINRGNIIFVRTQFSTEDLILFEDSTIENVLNDIKDFWKNKNKFEEFGFVYRRGILLWGVPGGGKTCSIKMIIKEVIKMGGLAIKFTNPEIYNDAIPELRSIQKDTPIVVIMEDLEALSRRFDTSLILNILDGVNSIDNIVYLATTNYPEELEGRLKNRPSRFDRRYHVGHLSTKSRAQLIKHFASKMSPENRVMVDIEKWAEDTNKMTPAHIKELFISVVLFNKDYDETLQLLKEMGKNVSSDKDSNEEYSAGFRRRD